MKAADGDDAIAAAIARVKAQKAAADQASSEEPAVKPAVAAAIAKAKAKQAAAQKADSAEPDNSEMSKLREERKRQARNARHNKLLLLTLQLKALVMARKMLLLPQ